MSNPLKFRMFMLSTCIAVAVCQPVVAGSDDALTLWSKFGVSPDRTRIAYPVPVYDEYSDLTTQVWVSNLDGSKKRQVATLPERVDVGWYDNSNLTSTKSHSNSFQIISLDGKQRTLALPGASEVCWPVVSPDGKWVVVSTYSANFGKMGIFLCDTKTGEMKMISPDVTKTYVSWSPDSKKLAYGEGDYQRNYKLKILDIKTVKITDTGKNGVGVEWSADGKRLAYVGNACKGGSWMDGVPVDGSIVMMDVYSMETKTLTKPGVNHYDELAKHREISGALWPLWSPDGKKIAYRQMRLIEDNGDKSLDEDEIWVVNIDGSGAKKLKDKWSRFVWAPDSKAILVKTMTGIERVAVYSGKSRSLTAWKALEAPKTMPEQTVEADGAEAKFTGIRPEYARALLTVAAEARRIYADTFGFDMPAKITLNIEKSPNGRTQLWTDGDSQIFLTVKSHADLAPPMQSGVFNIYGMCHELGHMAMYRKTKLIGLPEGVGQGWAHYIGSIVVDRVYEKFGKNVWPQPYNYSEIEGIARLAKSASDSDADKDSTVRAALVFYKAQEKYGEDKVISAMKTALDGKPWGKDVMPSFADALVKLTNDVSSGAVVPDEFLTSKVNWKVAQREINEKTTEGEAQVKDGNGVLLKYDDGTGESKRSTAGAGHAVMFYAPEGDWAVDSVQLYGSRYGEEVPPNENFFIFICDQDFNVIKTIEKPYNTFERGDPKWYTMTFDPVKVPRGFYVCIYFDPTATKGVYVYYDSSVTAVHSRSALPWTFVSDLNEGSRYDWMIRARLVKASE